MAEKGGAVVTVAGHACLLVDAGTARQICAGCETPMFGLSRRLQCTQCGMNFHKRCAAQTVNDAATRKMLLAQSTTMNLGAFPSLEQDDEGNVVLPKCTGQFIVTPPGSNRANEPSEEQQSDLQRSLPLKSRASAFALRRGQTRRQLANLTVQREHSDSERNDINKTDADNDVLDFSAGDSPAFESGHAAGPALSEGEFDLQVQLEANCIAQVFIAMNDSSGSAFASLGACQVECFTYQGVAGVLGVGVGHSRGFIRFPLSPKSCVRRSGQSVVFAVKSQEGSANSNMDFVLTISDERERRRIRDAAGRCCKISGSSHPVLAFADMRLPNAIPLVDDDYGDYSLDEKIVRAPAKLKDSRSDRAPELLRSVRQFNLDTASRAAVFGIRSSDSTTPDASPASSPRPRTLKSKPGRSSSLDQPREDHASQSSEHTSNVRRMSVGGVVSSNSTNQQPVRGLRRALATRSLAEIVETEMPSALVSSHGSKSVGEFPSANSHAPGEEIADAPFHPPSRHRSDSERKSREEIRGRSLTQTSSAPNSDPARPRTRARSINRGSSPSSNRPSSESPSGSPSTPGSNLSPGALSLEDRYRMHHAAKSRQLHSDILNTIELQITPLELCPIMLMRGRVKLIVHRNIAAASIGILLQGFEKVWAGSSAANKSKSFQSRQFFAHRVTLWTPRMRTLPGQQYPGIVPIGKHRWQFEYQLSDLLPPSSAFEDVAFLFYQARAYVEPADSKALGSYERVVSPAVYFDVYGSSVSRENAMLKSQEPSFASDHASGLHLSAHVKNIHQFLGSRIQIVLKVSDEKSSEIPKIDVALLQEVSTHAKKFSKTFPPIKLAVERRKAGKATTSASTNQLQDEMVVIWMEIPISDDGIHGNLSTLPSIDGELFKISTNKDQQMKINDQFSEIYLLPECAPSFEEKCYSAAAKKYVSWYGASTAKRLLQTLVECRMRELMCNDTLPFHK